MNETTTAHVTSGRSNPFEMTVVDASGGSSTERLAQTHRALELAARGRSAVLIDRATRTEKPQQIAVAIGSLETPSPIVKIACDLARRSHAALTLAHVVSSGELVAQAHHKLLAYLDDSPCAADVHITIPIGDTADEITALAGGFDILVIGGGNGDGGFCRPGSVTARVALGAPCSVLVASDPA